MDSLDRYELWFLTGSQHLYGADVLARVEAHSREIAAALDAATQIPTRVVHKPVLTTADAIRRLVLEANADDSCVGVVAWMHTFSPAKMWIAGLRLLQKPLLHLHTQFNAGLPWAEIDMDFMNLNQSAHGDREFGHLATRIGLRRKTVAGHWREPRVLDRDRRLGARGLRLARGESADDRPLRRQHARRWRSPTATRSRHRCSSGSRCTATASATSWMRSMP